MSILGDLILQLTRHPENAASAALEIILHRSPATMTGLIEVLQRAGVDEIEFAHIERESTGEAGDRPDFSIRDGAGLERAIIEAKFGAGLTENQPNTYLARLSTDKPSCLLFLCPDSRIEALVYEAKARVEDADPTAAGVVASLEGMRTVRFADGRRIAVLGWRHLLTSLSRHASAAADDAAVQDLAQLAGFVDQMDAAEFRPLHAEHLSQEVANVVLSLQGVIDDVVVRAREDDIATDTWGNRGTAHYYGSYLTLAGFEFWF
ncbi:MAG: hypothetical protein WD800_02255, partial [Dehalococcoidia bacterium]